MKIQKQIFGEATSVNFEFNCNPKFNGILGLGLPSSPDPDGIDSEHPIFSKMVQQGLIDYPVFAFYMNK